MQARMKNTSMSRIWFPGVLTVAALAALLALGPGSPEAELTTRTLTTMALWLALVTVAAMSPIPMPRSRASIGLAPALEFAGMLLFGPLLGCWIAVLGRLVANVAARWTPMSACWVRFSQAVLAVAASGAVFAALGGRFGAGMLEDPTALLAAAATHLAITVVIETAQSASAPLRLAGGKWWTSLVTLAALQTSLLPFGVLFALTELRIGTLGVALCLTPLLLARYSFRLWRESRASHLETVRTLMTAMDAADPFTWGLSYRVSKMSVIIGRELGLPPAELEELEYAALLHDIGRTAIKREILQKPGRLDVKEQAALSAHPRIGRDILARLAFFPNAPEIVHAHHEQPDGKGYPRGLRGDEIPIGSRIIMAVGAFDAMTSDRPYRRGLPPDVALEELLQNTGTQFFPEVVEALIHLYAQGRLFEEFDASVLAAYAGQQGNSRAIEEHLRRTGESIVLAAPPHTEAAPSGPAVIPGAAPSLRLVEAMPVEAELTVALDDSSAYRLQVAGRSDVGCVRQNNEDSFAVCSLDDDAGCLLILADGMGGAAAGEVASRIAVETVRSSFLAASPSADASARQRLRQAIEKANRTVHDRSRGEQALSGMGTTLTAAAVVGPHVIVGHVGDSRAYIVRTDSIEQLTADHTVAAELAEMNASGGSRAEHVLTRCLGSQAEVEVDITADDVRLEPGDRIVLCSDGLSGLVDEMEILRVVRATDSTDACRELVALARARGGPDNVTVVIGEMQAT